MGAKVESYIDDMGNTVMDDDIVTYKGREYTVIYISHTYVNLSGSGGLHLPFEVGKPQRKINNAKEVQMFKVGDKVLQKSTGEVYTITSINNNNMYNMNWFKHKHFGNCWLSDSELELVVEGPVRETTIIKKEIVPGTYGQVSVAFDGVVSMGATITKSKLTEAIKTLQLIHDAME